MVLYSLNISLLHYICKHVSMLLLAFSSKHCWAYVQHHRAGCRLLFDSLFSCIYFSHISYFFATTVGRTAQGLEKTGPHTVIHLTRMTVNNTMPSATTFAQWTIGQQELTKLCYSVAYCNTFWFCMTDFDSPSNVHLQYLCLLCFSVILVSWWAVCTLSMETSWVMSIWYESEHIC